MKKSHTFIIPTFLIVSFLFTNCAGPKPSIQSLAATNPAEVIALQDSLLSASKDDVEIIPVLVLAHTNIGDKLYQSKKYSEAIDVYNNALELNPRSKPALFGRSMSNGHIYYKKGSLNALWEAIEHFGKATVYMPQNGEPHYWMAKSYEKKDDDDFELIIEAYDAALSRNLPENIKADAKSSREKVQKAKETFEAFWK